MSAPVQHRVTLSPLAMATIKAIVDNVEMSPADRLAAAVVATFGWAWWEQQATLDPRQTAIPSDQWQAICGWLTEVPTGTLDKVNMGLSWMNSGPSSY